MIEDSSKTEDRMSEHAHTPGPWHINRDDWGAPTAIRSQDAQPVVATGPGFGSKAEIEANMNLIAAAPDMLEALQSALARLDNGYRLSLAEQRATAEQLRAAIAKAEGP